jgi:hypothetical protein
MAHEVMAKLEKELGRPVNPLEGLLRVGSDPDQPVSIRVQCYSEACLYLFPKLQSQSVVVEGPLEVAHVDFTPVLKNAAAVQMLQDLALQMTAQAQELDMTAQAQALDTPEVRALPPGPSGTDSHGHWNE